MINSQYRAHFLAGGVIAAMVSVSMLGSGKAWANPSVTDTCISGTLRYTSPDAESGAGAVETKAARNIDWALVEVGGSEIARGQTSSADGSFRACAPGGTKRYVKFESSSRSMRTAVVDPTSKAKFTHSTASVEQSSTDLGSVVVGTARSAATSRAWKIVDTLSSLYDVRYSNSSGCWVEGNCPDLVFHWSPTPGSGESYFDTQTNVVVLDVDDANSKHTIIHEAAHWLHFNTAPGKFPVVTGCSDHKIETRSSDTCAWTEGFADAAAAYALGDERYVFGDGTSVNINGAGALSGWDDGDQVQGRVGGSLLAIWKSIDNGSWNSTLRAIRDAAPKNFREYYKYRISTASASEKSALDKILATRTIRYTSP